jgi:hypothetical protein
VSLRGHAGVVVLACAWLAGCATTERAVSPPDAVVSSPTGEAMAPATVAVIGVMLGTSDPNDDTRLARRQDVFAPHDVIGVSIETRTSRDVEVAGRLDVLWTYDFQGETMTVAHERREFMFRGPGTSVFRIEKPDGFPPGRYRVDVALDGVPVERLEYTVRE